MSEDPKLKVKDILNYAKDVDESIAFSKWYIGNQTIKSRGQGFNAKKEGEHERWQKPSGRKCYRCPTPQNARNDISKSEEATDLFCGASKY